MKSLQLHVLATAAALVAACAITNLPAMTAGAAKEAAALNHEGKYLGHPDFKPIHVGH